jgi:hypothetical protein
MRLALSTIILVVSLGLGSGVTQPSPHAQDEIHLEINVTTHGYRTALKLDDESCQFGFPGLIDEPELVILGEDGDDLVREPMGIGDWSKPEDTAYCDQTYDVSVPSSEQYTIQIAPYFTEDFTAEDVQDGSLDIEITRDEGDPFPLPVRPEGGQIEDTDEYRIVGTLELRGTTGDEFLNMALMGCTGLGGYKDIQPGAQITISDQSGDIIAVTELEPDPLSEDFDECRFQFVAEVPEATFYSISLGRRGEMTYSFDDLEDAEWLIELSLG